MNQIDKTIFVSLAALILPLALSGCGADDESSSDHAQESGQHEHGTDMPIVTPEARDPSMNHHSVNPAMEKPADARKITVVATDFAFDPAKITAKPGEKLFVEMINQGNVVHMWQLEGKPETHIHTAAGKISAKVLIAPQKAGTYKTVCGTPGHVKHGYGGHAKG